MDAKTTAKALAATRLLIGAGLVLAPAAATRMWIGPHAGNEGSQVMARAMGARDAGLGLGTLASLGQKDERRRWLEAAVLADGVDLVATLAARRSLPAAAVTGAASVAGASAAAHLWLRHRLG